MALTYYDELEIFHLRGDYFQRPSDKKGILPVSPATFKADMNIELNRYRGKIYNVKFYRPKSLSRPSRWLVEQLDKMKYGTDYHYSAVLYKGAVYSVLLVCVDRPEVYLFPGVKPDGILLRGVHRLDSDYVSRYSADVFRRSDKIPFYWNLRSVSIYGKEI